MSLISRIFNPRHDDRAYLRPLWHRVVELARDRRWYAQCGIADTLTGRFDAITLLLALTQLRMERDPALIPASSHLTELFAADMDGQLRQSGVGDLAVGKQMPKLISALGGRIGALRDALPFGVAGVTPVIERNISLVEGADPARAAALVLDFARKLAATSGEDLLAAKIAL